MSTTGTVINCVFNTIAELGDPHSGSPFVNIVDNVKANILNRNIIPQPRNIESHTWRAIKYGLKAGIIAEPQKGCFKILEASRNPVPTADKDVNVDDGSVEYNENDKRLGQHRFYDDEDIDEDSDEKCCQSESDSNDQSCDEAEIEYPDACCEEPPCCEEESECCSEDSDECEANDEDGEGDADSEFYGNDAENVRDNDDANNDNLSYNKENNDEKYAHKCCGERTNGRDDSIANEKNRFKKNDKLSQEDRCKKRCVKQPRCKKPPEMNCEPTQPCCPKQPNNPCPPRNPKSPCEPKQPCGPCSPYPPKNPKNPREPECPNEPDPPTRCVCCPRPNKCQSKCCRDEPEHFGSHKDEHFDENESDDFDNSIKSYEVDDFKGDFKENNENQNELEQIGNISCRPSCGPSCGGGGCNDEILGKKRRQSDANDNDHDSKSTKRHRTSIPNDKFNISSIAIANDPIKEINLVDTTAEYVNGKEYDSQIKTTNIDSSLNTPMDYNPDGMELPMKNSEFPYSNA